MMENLPKKIPANKDNDLLFRNSCKSPEQLREEEKKKKVGDAMNEGGHNPDGPLEYFTD